MPSGSPAWIVSRGQTLRIAAWARQLGLHRASMSWRLKHWSIEAALTRPRKARGAGRAPRTGPAPHIDGPTLATPHGWVPLRMWDSTP